MMIYVSPRHMSTQLAIASLSLLVINKNSSQHTSLVNHWPGCPLRPHLGPNFSEYMTQNIGHMHLSLFSPVFWHV